VASVVKDEVGAEADGLVDRAGACCALGAVCEVADGAVCMVVDGAVGDVVDGADWVYGAGAVVDGVPTGLGAVGVCAQTGAAIARAAARAVPLKSCFINLTSDMTAQAKPPAPNCEAFA